MRVMASDRRLPAIAQAAIPPPPRRFCLGDHLPATGFQMHHAGFQLSNPLIQCGQHLLGFGLGFEQFINVAGETPDLANSGEKADVTSRLRLGHSFQQRVHSLVQ
jgi:hypothetical protein